MSTNELLCRPLKERRKQCWKKKFVQNLSATLKSAAR